MKSEARWQGKEDYGYDLQAEEGRKEEAGSQTAVLQGPDRFDRLSPVRL